MNIEEQVCSREQMAELKKLGIDDSEASMCWIHYETDGADEWFVAVHDESCYEASCMDATPTFSVMDIINTLCKLNVEIAYCWDSWKIVIYSNEYFPQNANEDVKIESCGEIFTYLIKKASLRDAVFSAYKWAAENEILTDGKK